MKKQSITIFRKGIYSSLITSALLFATLTSTHAANQELQDTTKKAEIKFAGKSDKYLAFDVSYQNGDQKKFVVQLQDRDSRDIIYQKEYHDSTLNRKIFLLVEDIDCTLTFRIKKGKEIHEQSFNISNEMKMVDDLSVTRL